MKKLLFLLLLLPLQLKAQPGCTDPQANNYDPMATENDGSCLYPPTSIGLDLVGELPVDLVECSGLAFFDETLWTHLDGGNLDRLFTLDTLTAEKLETITVPNTDNIDWEDLAEDEEHLYIGDFGNNFGDRTDLRIFKIKKSDLLAGTISPEVIEFSYSDQTDFTPMQNATEHDCEAFFFWQDSLHLFSKDWLNFKTRHYVLPVTPGNHTAQLRDSLEVQGLITAADITEDGTALVMGYALSGTFAWLLFDFQGNDVFSGNQRKISIGSLQDNGQVEGLTFRDGNSGYICSENFGSWTPKLQTFDIQQFLENPVSAVQPEARKVVVSIFPNPANEVLHVVVDLPVGKFARLKIVDETGRVFLEKQMTGGEMALDISHLRNGNYWLQVVENEEITKSNPFQIF